MENNHFYKSFKSVYDLDKKEYIKKWMVRWKYIDIFQNKKDFYQLERLYSYRGKSELIDWLDYCTKQVKFDYFPEPSMKSLMKLSMETDKRIFKAIGLEFKWSNDNYNRFIGRTNAQEYKLQNFYPVPERYKIKNILDFGAGFGRQANLWSKQDDIIYVGMDAIPNSYCVQNLYYQNLNVPFYEYVDNSKSFKISNNKGIYHLPTWRYDLLPDSFFDLVICSQVLSEIDGTLAKKMIKEFFRILKPGGALYLRDPGPYMHKCGNKVNIDKYIEKNGFVLEFRPYVLLHVDLHSFPRIWRKSDDRVERSGREKVSLLNEINYYSNGLLKKWGRKLINMIKK